MNEDTRRNDSPREGARHLLTLNAGSSSLKFAVFAETLPVRRLTSGAVTRIGLAGAALSVSNGATHAERAVDASEHAGALDAVLAELEPRYPIARAAAVGHRVVHGGPLYDRARLATPDVLAELRRLAPLDVDHLPAEIAIIEAVGRRAPLLPQVASFDTAFHADMPRVARLLAIPRRYEADGVRRYGFHGLSYTYLTEALGHVAGSASASWRRVVLAHLGAGASMAAVLDGRCVDTTMGFTPTSGILMGTRSGDLDPGVLLYLLRSLRGDVGELDDMLNHRSGLLGVSDSSPDMSDLLAREAEDPRAADAVALFCHQSVKAVGALAATLGGLDALVFSGGIGEHAAPVRARIARRLGHLGVDLDEARNDASATVISTASSRSTVLVLPTDEASILARETLGVLDTMKADRERQI